MEVTRNFSVSRQELKEYYFECTGKRKDRHAEILEKIFERESLNPQEVVNYTDCKHLLRNFIRKLELRIERCRRGKVSFDEKCSDWLLQEPVELTVRTIRQPSPPGEPKLGRPVQQFDTLAEKTKKRKVQHLLQHDSEQLLLAGRLALHASGDRSGAKRVKLASERSSSPALDGPSSSTTGRPISPAIGPPISPAIGRLISPAIGRPISPAIDRPSSVLSSASSSAYINSRMATPEEALALFLDNKSTKNSYMWERKFFRSLGHESLPPYYAVQKAKHACRPLKELLTITESGVDAPVQAILDLTGQRLCIAQSPKLAEPIAQGVRDFILLYKWGLDGSNASEYKQKLGTTQRGDKTLILFSFVPLELRTASSLLVWRNPAPGSPRYCRPFKIIFKEESTECVVQETSHIESQIRTLSLFKVMIGDTEITVRHQLLLTMVDGKVVNSLTGTTSTLRCFICRATQVELEKLQSPPADAVENFRFGLQTLHAWIRLLEFLLNIAYKKGIEEEDESQVPLQGSDEPREESQNSVKETKAEKKAKRERDRLKFLANKARIQNEFWDKLSLRVDQPKANFGSTNDGNTARIFFRKAAVSAAITGIDERLIHRFRVILSALSSESMINAGKFENYAKETKSLLSELHPKHRLTPTVHKILDHGASVIRYFGTIPFGSLTEEPQEARHKECRRYRRENTRKTSRTETIFDLYAMLCASSDPIVNIYRKPEHTKRAQHGDDPDVDALLIPQPGILINQMAALDLGNSSESRVSDSSDIDSPRHLTAEEQDSDVNHDLLTQ